MKILVAGLPKTGTTGLLYKIYDNVPEPKRLIFEPEKYEEMQGDSERTVLCKIVIAPHLDIDSFKIFSKKVTIIRDPRDRMVSSILYSQFHCNYANDESKIKSIREILQQKEADPKSIPLLHIVDAMWRANHGEGDHVGEFLNYMLESEKWLEDYLSQINDTYILKYEDFVAGNLEGLEKYLGFELSQLGGVPQEFRRVERTKRAGDWKNWFTNSDIEKLSKLFEPVLRKYNYDLSWDISTKQTINPEHCSEYFMRLIEERRRIL